MIKGRGILPSPFLCRQQRRPGFRSALPVDTQLTEPLIILNCFLRRRVEFPSRLSFINDMASRSNNPRGRALTPYLWDLFYFSTSSPITVSGSPLFPALSCNCSSTCFSCSGTGRRGGRRSPGWRGRCSRSSRRLQQYARHRAGSAYGHPAPGHISSFSHH